jgi:hypothetical protein
MMTGSQRSSGAAVRPTAGAVIVNAGNVSGRIGSWRVEGTSKTYQDWHEGKLAKAGAAPAEVE